MIRYAYQLKDFRTWLHGFAKALKLKVEAGQLLIPTSMGDGYLLASNINADISYVVMNFSLNEDLVLLRRKSSLYGLSLFFNQIIVSDFAALREPHHSITDKSPVQNNIFLSSTNYDLEATWSKNSRFKRVGIYFSPDFVSRYIKRDLLLDLLVYSENRLHLLEQEPLTFEYKQTLEDIFKVDRRSPVAHLLLHNRVLLLAETYLSSFLARASQRKERSRSRLRGRERDVEALRDVEKILTNHRLIKFPSIDELAKTAMMSTTKLKTKFKETYGMKLYEYFKRNRLEKAREMLQSGRYTVKQAGQHVGYSNMSNFTKAFKKEFGILPKKLAKGNSAFTPRG